MMQLKRKCLIILLSGLLLSCGKADRNDTSSESICPPPPKVEVCNLKALATKYKVNSKNMGFEPEALIYRYAARVNSVAIEREKADYRHANPQCALKKTAPLTLVETGSCPNIDRFSKDRLAALKTAEIIQKNVPNWQHVLPNCPCDEKKVPDFWSGEPAKQDYHPGATRCYRSLPVSQKALKGAGLAPDKISPGQQCCYDKDQKLITSGAAAGTPDLYVPIDAESNTAHANVDVALFHKLGFEVYNVYWPPNNGNQCPGNPTL